MHLVGKAQGLQLLHIVTQLTEVHPQQPEDLADIIQNGVRPSICSVRENTLVISQLNQDLDKLGNTEFAGGVPQGTFDYQKFKIKIFSIILFCSV